MQSTRGTVASASRRNDDVSPITLDDERQQALQRLRADLDAIDASETTSTLRAAVEVQYAEALARAAGRPEDSRWCGFAETVRDFLRYCRSGDPASVYRLRLVVADCPHLNEPVVSRGR